MDSFELNKIAGAVLGTLLAVMAVGVLGDALFHQEAPEQPGWAVAIEEEGEGGGAAEEEQATPLPVLLASADADAGANVAKKCQSCHSFEAGGPNKVGPGLHDIVGRPIAAHEGFSYSQAFQEKSSEGFEWTYEHLFHFLENPRGYISGTAMAFAGVKDDQDRADLIAYLRTVTESPPPLPEPEAAPAEGEGQAAEGEGQAEGEAASGGEQSGAEQPTQEAGHGDGGQPTEPEPQEEAAQEDEAAQAEPAGDQAEQQQAAAEGQAEPVPETPAPSDQTAMSGAATSETPAAAPAEEQQTAQAESGGEMSQDGGESSGGGGGLVSQIAAASVEDGQSEARKCMACHTFDEGGPNRVGPNLWGIVDRPVAGHEGYSYSNAMKDVGGEWSFDKLDTFLTNPREYAKGTKMAFPGVRDDGDRHALLHYLYTLQSDPAPLQ